MDSNIEKREMNVMQETRINVLGIEFDDVTMEEAVEKALSRIEAGEKGYIVTPNPEIVWMSRENSRLRKAIEGASQVLADGVGITIGARILGSRLKERVPGIDFAERVIGKLSERGGRVFLLGAKPGVAEVAGSKLAEKYPGIKIAGFHDGYFTDSSEVISQINESRPELLLVCLGAPKQELWMSENIGALDVSISIGLGGALDVFAGQVIRAPVLLRRLGLEWLYRLIRQPSRIKRALKIPLFIFAVFRLRIKGC